MKTTTLVMLLIVSLQAHASSIGWERPGELSKASDVSESADSRYLLEASSNFRLELPVTLTGAHFCAVSDSSACGVSSLMVMLGTVGSAARVVPTTTTSESSKADLAVASRVVLPATWGLFGIALLALTVIRCRQSV